jgi:hypothetical protein
MVVDFQNGDDDPCKTVVGLDLLFQNDHERESYRNPLLVEKVFQMSERMRYGMMRDSGC